YLDALADDGSCVLLAPADRETSIGLREVERAVATPGSEWTVFAPTLRLWAHQSPADVGWSFDERPEIDVPATQRQLADAADPNEFPDRTDFDPESFTNTSVRFSYAILRRDGERRLPIRGSTERHARLSESEKHVTNRVDLLAVKLSRDLADGGNPVYRIGDGSQQVDHYAVLTKESAFNEDLPTAPYGSVLSFENALILWNDDEAAYNVVCDAETIVDLVG
ncbi:MAG: SAM-dependent methyltransferase, partial [Halobaculum sp.]